MMPQKRLTPQKSSPVPYHHQFSLLPGNTADHLPHCLFLLIFLSYSNTGAHDSMSSPCAYCKKLKVLVAVSLKEISNLLIAFFFNQA